MTNYVVIIIAVVRVVKGVWGFILYDSLCSKRYKIIIFGEEVQFI